MGVGVQIREVVDTNIGRGNGDLLRPVFGELWANGLFDGRIDNDSWRLMLLRVEVSWKYWSFRGTKMWGGSVAWQITSVKSTHCRCAESIQFVLQTLTL